MNNTPGPWRVTEYQPNKRTNRTISIIWGQQVSPLAEVENGPREANARLIAAAPELLQALHLITRSFEEYCPRYEEDQFWKMAQEALAKAGGRQ